MPDIKIKRYADKENLKKLMKYSKDTFATKSETNEKFYTKEQVDSMLEGVSGGTGGGSTGGDYYTKSEIDTKLTSKANTSDLSAVATSGSYNDLLDKPNIPDINNLYTKAQTDELLILKADSSKVYTKTEVDNLISGGATVDLTNYYTKTEVDNLLSNIGGDSATNTELDELTTEWSFE